MGLVATVPRTQRNRAWNRVEQGTWNGGRVFRSRLMGGVEQGTGFLFQAYGRRTACPWNGGRGTGDGFFVPSLWAADCVPMFYRRADQAVNRGRLNGAVWSHPRVLTGSPELWACVLLDSRLARGLPLESRFARPGLLVMRLARVNLLVFRFARLAKRDSDRIALAKRKTGRASLAKRKNGRASLAKRDSSRSLPRQTQKRQKPGGRPVKSDAHAKWRSAREGLPFQTKHGYFIM